ncbi:MAG: T9SS type A sorting domain-containing protein, partial [Marinoscillum sp.]
AINWFRIYNSKSGSVTNRIDAIKLVSNGGARTSNSLDFQALSIKEAKIYPNPVSEFVTIELGSKASEGVTVVVYNMAGLKVLDQNFDQPNTRYRIPVEYLNSGVYLIEVQAGNQSVTKRIIIE